MPTIITFAAVSARGYGVSSVAVGIAVVAADPNFYQTVALLNGETSAPNFLADASTNRYAPTIYGTLLPSRFNPHWGDGYYGIYCNGGYVSFPIGSSTVFNWGASATTIECWIYPNGVFGTSPICARNNGSGTVCDWEIFINPAGTLNLYYASTLYSSTLKVPPNAWSHVAFVFNGSSSFGFYINGVPAGTFSFLYAVPTTSFAYFCVGYSIGGGYEGSGVGANFYGYISNFRIINGTALYTSAFTPPTSPLTAIAGTGFLTCQSSRTIDNSANAINITYSSAPVSSNHPFPLPSGAIQNYGSAYFDGSTSAVSYPASSSVAFGTGSFTIEGWYNLTNYPSTTQYLIDTRASGTWYIGIGLVNSGRLEFYDTLSTVVISYAGSAVTNNNTWTHFAFVRNGTTLTLYLNGVSVASASHTTSHQAGNVTIGQSVGVPGTSAFNGYLYNIRIVSGTAVYTSAFTPPTTPLTAISGTVLLTLQGKQHYNNNVFYDDSNYNTAVTAAGYATQGSFSPFSQGGWSNYFPGDYNFYYFTDNSNYVLGTNNFTIEAWIYPLLYASGNNVIVCKWNGSGSRSFLFALTPTGALNFQYNSSGNYSIGTVPLNKWSHVAAVQISGVVYLYLNGARIGSVTPGAAIGSGQATAYLTVGQNYEAYNSGPLSGYNFNGYISNLRIVNGTAIYTTATYTVPTAPLTTVTNTVLLTCSTNRFADTSVINSSTVFITTTTSALPLSVTPLAPFAPGVAYSSTATSGSIYVSGTTTGDWVTVNPTAGNVPALNLFGTKYTIECWVYPLTFANNSFVLMQDDNGTGNSNFQLAYNSSGTFYYLFYYSGTRINSVQLNSVTPLQKNAWNHLAATYDGTYTRTYLNGVYQASTSQSYTWIGFTATQTVVGNYTSAWGYQTATYSKLNAYVSNIRMVRGTALYTGTNSFSVPTAPLSVVSYISSTTTATTSLLLSATNAGAIDQSSRFNLAFTTATVVAPQPQILSPGTVQYGSGSLRFRANADYAYVASSVANPLFAFGTGDFTIEFWVYMVGYSSGGSVIYDGRAVGTTSYANIPCIIVGGSGAIQYATNGTTSVITGSNLNLSTWYHVAVTRASSVARLFLNGVQQGSNYSDSQTYISNANRPIFGGDGSYTTNSLNGYIDDLRVTKGYARYTSGFTAPTQSFAVK